MHAAPLPLEDTFGDVLHKAMRGNAVDASALSAATGIDARSIAAWLKDDGTATHTQADALARALHLDPHKLADAAAAGWEPPAIERPNVRMHAQRPHPSNGYVFFLDDRRAALVDPAGRPQNLLQILRDGKYHLQYVLITHKHADHCDAAGDVAAAFPQAQVVMHRLDVAAIGPELAAKALPVRDGEDLPFGDDAHIRMLHTPGHTDGSSCYVFDGMLFSGDTLFAGSVGGAFGDASTYSDILNSVRSKLFTLPDETVLMPGHGPPTTIALAREHNPFLPG